MLWWKNPLLQKWKANLSAMKRDATSLSIAKRPSRSTNAPIQASVPISVINARSHLSNILHFKSTYVVFMSRLSPMYAKSVARLFLKLVIWSDTREFTLAKNLMSAQYARKSSFQDPISVSICRNMRSITSSSSANNVIEFTSIRPAIGSTCNKFIKRILTQKWKKRSTSKSLMLFQAQWLNWTSPWRFHSHPNQRAQHSMSICKTRR